MLAPGEDSRIDLRRLRLRKDDDRVLRGVDLLVGCDTDRR